MMQDGSRITETSRRKLHAGIAASIALHAIVAGSLLIHLPPSAPVPAEESVSVELVAPPEPLVPDPPAPEEKPLRLSMPETKPEEQKPTIPEPPEPPKQEAEEAGGEPPPPSATSPTPAETQEEDARPEAEAKPEPEPKQEKLAEQAPPPAPAPEPAAEKQELPPPAEQQESGELRPARPMPVLRPVVQFGEKDMGSRQDAQGNASEQAGTPEADAGEEQAQSAVEPGSERSAQDAQETGRGGAPQGETDPAAPGVPSVLTAKGGDPTILSQPAEGMGSGANAAPNASGGSAPLAETSREVTGKPLKEAKRLFSTKETGVEMAMTAMGDMPRDIRASQLCTTELREQLRHGVPAFQPDILPSFPLPDGTVLDIRQAAFRADGQWFDVRFRCEIDIDATRVVSFAVQVGDAVPRSQWKSRGFPRF